MKRANIVIIGGGIVGSSIAYHLAAADRSTQVVVIERDPTYADAATPRSNGGIRRLFSLPENIEMASYGLAFYRDFATTMGIGDESADIGFLRQGYLFVSDRGGAKQMEDNYRLQTAHGVEVDMLTANELKTRFPSIDTNGVELAVHSHSDAWIDPHAALMGLRAKARALGVEYLHDEVTSLDVVRGTIGAARLRSGQTIAADYYVNACGAWCAELAATVDVDLPVQPMSRESYYFTCPTSIEPLPFVKTETDLAFRPEGNGFVGGLPDWSETPGWNFDVSQSYFEDVMWPALAERVPALSTLRLERSWRGHYAKSLLDLSPIIGPVGAKATNLLLANGFSGHGIMHAPATGRAVSELLLKGRYEAIDLTAFGYERIVRQAPYRERGIV